MRFYEIAMFIVIVNMMVGVVASLGIFGSAPVSEKAGEHLSGYAGKSAPPFATSNWTAAVIAGIAAGLLVAIPAGIFGFTNVAVAGMFMGIFGFSGALLVTTLNNFGVPSGIIAIMAVIETLVFAAAIMQIISPGWRMAE